MKLTLIQAANETGKDRSTIFRAIKKGTISADKQDNGGYLIDPVELFRVYPPKKQQEDTQRCATDATQHDAQGVLVDALKSQIELLRDQVEREREQADYWRQTATMLLTHQPEAPKQTSVKKEDSALWRKLFGRDG